MLENKIVVAKIVDAPNSSEEIHLIFIVIRWSRSGSTTVAIEEEGEKKKTKV